MIYNCHADTYGTCETVESVISGIRNPPSMRKRDLEIRLESVQGFSDPDPALEQYMTPATIAADILYTAYSSGDVSGLKVMDLGCGTGMFSIGSWLLGAGMVVGYDISESALAVAERNRSAFGADVEFRLGNIIDVDEGADTVFMNPPFGCQNRNADRSFLDKAMDSSECVYSIHMASTLEFVEKYCERRGRSVAWYKMYKYVIPHTFSFHSKEKKSVDIVAVNIR